MSDCKINCISPIVGNCDRPTDRQTVRPMVRPGHREVSLQISTKIEIIVMDIIYTYTE